MYTNGDSNYRILKKNNGTYLLKILSYLKQKTSISFQTVLVNTQVFLIRQLIIMLYFF